ncbi:MAG: ribosome assembly cofactor RimP [Muribaculaceae bacterium]|nr:ribosome assembly cofactor RimP [Muribaculaceae bacterium]
MIDKEGIKDFVEKELEGSEYYLVDLKVSANNEITVEIDSDENVDIDFCIDLTRKIEEAFSRDEEDYELEVGSCGLTSPFKVLRQYQKHIGDEVEVIEKTGRKQKGILKSADPDKFVIEIMEKVKPEGAKRPVMQARDLEYGYGDVKQVTYVLNF